MRVWRRAARAHEGIIALSKAFPAYAAGRDHRGRGTLSALPRQPTARGGAALGARRSCSACPSRVRSSARTCRRSAANFSTCYGAAGPCPWLGRASECSARSSDSTPTASRSTRSSDGSNGATPSPKHWPDSPISTNRKLTALVRRRRADEPSARNAPQAG